jgi:hypothetical protein
MHDLLIDSENFRKHVDRATASFSSIALFGQRANSNDDFWATVSRPQEDLKREFNDVSGRIRSYGSGTACSLH